MERSTLVELLPNLPEPARSNSACWWLSAAAHLVALVGVGLLVRPPLPPGAEEPGRPVSIVLAQRDAGHETQFLDSAAFSEVETSPDAEASKLVAEALPDATADDRLFDRANLPQPADDAALAAAIGAGLLEAPRLGGARRRPLLASGGEAAILAGDSVRNRPPAPAGPKARVDLFGVPAEGRTFVFLLDRSQSMGAIGALAAAERELLRALAGLDASHRFQIVAYNNDLKNFSPRGLTPGTTQYKEQARQFLGGLVPVAGTKHEMALQAGLRLLPEVIFLLTDGDEPPLSDGQLRQLALRAGKQTTIHCIHFGVDRPGDDHFLKRLAELTGGGYRYVEMK